MWPRSESVFWLVVGLATLALVAVLRDALLPFAIGTVLAYFLNPVADGLQRLGIGRTLAAALVVGLAALAFVASAVIVLPLVAGQLRQLAVSLPGDLERLRTAMEAWAARELGDHFPAFKATLERSIGELGAGAGSLLAGLAGAAWSRGMALVSLVSLLLITPVVTFYLLRDWPRMLHRIDGWLPRDHAPAIRAIFSDIDHAVGAFVRGQGTICLLLGVFYAAALSTVGLRYGLVVGLFTGLLAFVPMAGWALGLVWALVLALSQGWPDTTLALWVLGIYAVGMAIDAAILSPSIVGEKVGLHPVWLMLALFVFSALFGGLGVIVAVPVAAALAVLVRFARDRYLASEIYRGHDGSAGRQGAGASANEG